MPPAFLHIGHLRLPLFGLCAAVGLMCALTLCQITARLVRLDPTRVWDAALATIFAAFAISRVLLIAGSWRSFLAAPLLILALPSLNDTGILFTIAFLVIYLRVKRLPLLGFLDAIAPCVALAWAFLSLGEILAGTRDGMPTRFFLAIHDRTAGSPQTRPLPTGALVQTQPVQPVEIYTLVLAMLLCGILIRILPRLRHTGLGCALALGLAGAALFLLDFLRLPAALFAAAILDPVQWLGLGMVVTGCALWIAAPALPVVAPWPTMRTKMKADF